LACIFQTQNSKPRVVKQDGVHSKKKKEHLLEETPEQWEEWKQKDSQIVDVTYKDDLEEALLLSKLDYEERKTYYESKPVVETKPIDMTEKKSGKKNKKTIRVLSVEEFHNLGKYLTKVFIRALQ